MPCYKCNNGKYKYGKRGRCQFDTLERCRAAEAAIHAREDSKKQIDHCCQECKQTENSDGNETWKNEARQKTAL